MFKTIYCYSINTVILQIQKNTSKNLWKRKKENQKKCRKQGQMFVPTHIAHKYDWSPVDRIWSMRDSRHDSIDAMSFTSLIKESISSIDLLDVIGLSLRKPKRQIEWKPYHSSIAIHHLAQINDKNDTSIYNNRYLYDLLEECSISVNVLKPRFIAQIMWSLDKLNIINNPILNNRGKLCLLKCADALNNNPLIYKIEIWNIADCIKVLTKYKLYKHPLIYKLSQKIININRNNEWFGINDIAQSYSILAHSFGKISKYRPIMIDNDNQNDEYDQIDYKSLSHALIERFMNHKIYKAANNFEILNFLKGIGAIMINNDKLSFSDGLQKLENDLYQNIQSMHIKDIAVITNAFINILDKNAILNESQWINYILNNYLSNMIKKDGFSLLMILIKVLIVYIILLIFYVKLLRLIMANKVNIIHYYVNILMKYSVLLRYSMKEMKNIRIMRRIH